MISTQRGSPWDDDGFLIVALRPKHVPVNAFELERKELAFFRDSSLCKLNDTISPAAFIKRKEIRKPYLNLSLKSAYAGQRPDWSITFSTSYARRAPNLHSHCTREYIYDI